MAVSARLIAAFAAASLFASASAQAGFPPYFDKVVTAHGILGALTFVILLPLGGLIIRVGNFPGVFWAHAIIQLVAYSAFCFVFGSGLWFSSLFGSYTDPHIVIGIILFGLATLQPFLGTIHHQKLKKYERRTFASIVHIHLGRSLVAVGMINGGLGLLLGDDATVGEIQAYGIIAGIMWITYTLVVSYMEVQDAKLQKWLAETDGAMTKQEIGIEARKFGVYEST